MKPSQELIDEVLEQIKSDVADGDLTAIEELLTQVPLETLKGYLPEIPKSLQRQAKK